MFGSLRLTGAFSLRGRDEVLLAVLTLLLSESLPGSCVSDKPIEMRRLLKNKQTILQPKFPH